MIATEVTVLFLSTPSARRATKLSMPLSCSSIFLSTPSARRATPRPRLYGQRLHISIHALREEGDLSDPKGFGSFVEFLSTPSARRATEEVDDGVDRIAISIHALREEGDR